MLRLKGAFAADEARQSTKKGWSRIACFDTFRSAHMPVPDRRRVVLKLDGQTMPLDIIEPSDSLYLVKQADGTWRHSEDWPPDNALRKVRGLEGPVHDVFLAPFTVLVGSHDERWFKTAEAEAWRFVAEWFRQFGTKPRVISDGAVTDEMLANRNMVFF